MLDDSTDRVPVIAIAGGGASGALTAVHLLRDAATRGTPLRVVLIDRYGRHGLGQAYSTPDPRHLLNACVAKMSALADDPGHLLRWARERGLGAEATDFLPRAVYGRYLRDVLDGAGPVARVTGTVSSVGTSGVSRPVRVHLANGGRIDADAVVLATGNRVSGAWPQVPSGPRYIADPWAPGALDRVRDGAPVLVVGTGLTMVDVAVTLTGAHPGTVVHAVSRHGLLPREHRCPAPPPAELSLPAGTPRLTDLVRFVRAAAKDSGDDWQGVMDAMRPHVQRLWAGLGIEDRRCFLSLMARYWEVHRHRIPPRTAERIRALRAEGRLDVLCGRLASATASHGDAAGPYAMRGATTGYDATVRLAGGGTRELRVGWLVNATGPGSAVTEDPFLGGLFAAGVARPDPLALGLDAADDGAVIDAAGRPHDRIFTLGPTLRGLRYETTAIPEIREQAAALAPRLIEAVGAPAPRELVPV